MLIALINLRITYKNLLLILTHALLTSFNNKKKSRKNVNNMRQDNKYFHMSSESDTMSMNIQFDIENKKFPS